MHYTTKVAGKKIEARKTRQIAIDEVFAGPITGLLMQ
jgi:hypothetical protein